MLFFLKIYSCARPQAEAPASGETGAAATGGRLEMPHVAAAAAEPAPACDGRPAPAPAPSCNGSSELPCAPWAVPAAVLTTPQVAWRCSALLCLLRPDAGRTSWAPPSRSPDPAHQAQSRTPPAGGARAGPARAAAVRSSERAGRVRAAARAARTARSGRARPAALTRARARAGRVARRRACTAACATCARRRRSSLPATARASGTRGTWPWPSWRPRRRRPRRRAPRTAPARTRCAATCARSWRRRSCTRSSTCGALP